MKILQINEIRKAYFLKAFGREPEDMLIISMGACNYNCSYCKRDGQFKGNGNSILNAYDVAMDEIFGVIDKHVAAGHRIRLSGGDPCMFPAESLQIAKYCWDKHGKKISLAHNGSSPSLISSLLPYLDYVAIDFKGATPEEIARRSNTLVNPASIGNIMQIIDMCQQTGVLVDIRTVIFGDTDTDDLGSIGHKLSAYNNVFWTLRKYNPVIGCDFLPAENDTLVMADRLSNTYNIPVGYRDKWTGCNFYIASQFTLAHAI